MEIRTNDLILRTVTVKDIEEIARMWEYPHETTIDKAYEALKYMEDTHSRNRKKSICHLCLGVFQKKEPNMIIGWCGLDVVQNSLYENGDYIFAIDRETFLNFKR